MRLRAEREAIASRTRRKGRETRTAADSRLSSDEVWDREIRETSILRKEVIQPQVPLRLPCYDFGPVADPTVAGCLLAVSAPS